MMAKEVKKLTYVEGLALADACGNLTHVFNSESGFKVTLDPASPGKIVFTDKNRLPIASHGVTVTGQKQKPQQSQLAHQERFLYYYKRAGVPGLVKYHLSDRVTPNVVYMDTTDKYTKDYEEAYFRRKQDRNYVDKITAYVVEAPKPTTVVEEHVRIYNLAVGVVNRFTEIQPPVKPFTALPQKAAVPKPRLTMPLVQATNNPPNVAAITSQEGVV